MALDFVALFDEHYAAIEGYLLRRLVDGSMAEDLASQTFSVAFARRASYDPERGNPRSWLFGIATNLLSHHFRSERRQLLAYARAASREHVPADGADDICNRVDARMRSADVAAALATLSPRELAVLTLHCWAELTNDEIANALKIPVGTVKSCLHRVRRKLRAKLGPGIVEDDDG